MQKEQLEYIQGQTNKIRNLVDHHQLMLTEFLLMS